MVVIAPGYTSVPYYPTHDTWAAKYHRKKDVNAALPHGFPRQLSGKLVWDGEDLSLAEHTSDSGTECVLKLNDSQLAEIDAALRHFQGLGMPMDQLNPKTFPLPSLHHVLRAVSDNLHKGYGFTMIRGIPVDNYNAEENMIIYVGVSSHIAPVRGRQNSYFNQTSEDVMVTHITNYLRSKDDDRILPAGHTDKEITFHSDIGDIVSLYALDEPVTGGESLLASTWRLYNEIAKTRPDLIRVLADNWPMPIGTDYSVQRPLLYYLPPNSHNPERITVQYSRRPFSEIRPKSWPITLTEEQVEALDTIQFLCEKLAVSIQIKKGDIQFINNMSVLHGRTGYEDGSKQRRHLIRLWLRDPENAWATPSQLQSRWDKLYHSKHSNGPQAYPLEPPLH
ncbi:hypothetical protein IFM46972_09011 [Aspergillus udagawae]|uniref:TauD/TfdA-like domain-containing protein n=1 Tax=Aspergillus udagawae TaxID=91492 RepID=A0A8H3PBB7_9EURO|nr:hypothetical protein IFM46972_09011 [Aspergillus udagawae]